MDAYGRWESRTKYRVFGFSIPMSLCVIVCRLGAAHEPPQDHYDMEDRRLGAGAYGHVFTVTQRSQ